MFCYMQILTACILKIMCSLNFQNAISLFSYQCYSFKVEVRKYQEIRTHSLSSVTYLWREKLNKDSLYLFSRMSPAAKQTASQPRQCVLGVTWQVQCPPQGWCPLPFCGFTCPCPGDFEYAVVRVVHHMHQVNSVKCGYIQSVTAKTPVPTLVYCLYLKNWSVTAYSNIQRKGRHSMRK